MDLLLVEAEQKSPSEAKITTPPLGLAYIAAVSEERGYSVEIVDLNVDRANLEEKIKEAGLVGISCYTHNYHDALNVLEMAKGHGRKVVIGGPHASFEYKEALRDGFDFAVRGEGEFVVPELLGSLKGDGKLEIKGLVFEKNGEIRTKGVWRVEDLDALPLPARHLLDLERYTYPGAIATSRGCVYSCRYCSSRAISGHLRLRKAERVIEEIAHIKALGLDSFFVIDPNFAFDKERVIEICKGVEDLEMEWYAELRLDHVDIKVIKAMARAGCKVGRFGIESGCQRIVDLIRKDIRVKDVLRVVEAFVENSITPVCGFMIGHPTETEEEFEATLRLALKIKELGGEATFAVQTPYPGTYIRKNAEKLGIEILDKEWREYHHLNPVIETGNFSNDDLRRMLFDSIMKVMDIRLPEVEVTDERPEILNIGEGICRRSFRSIARE
jgi:radical SAM superfamily enzyme YgiQ (UPF0313 family)